MLTAVSELPPEITVAFLDASSLVRLSCLFDEMYSWHGIYRASRDALFLYDDGFSYLDSLTTDSVPVTILDKIPLAVQ